MKIAIFHNLKPGGALLTLCQISKILNKTHSVDIYCLNDNTPQNISNNIFVFPLKQTNNILQHILQVSTELVSLNKKIAGIIENCKYDLLLVFPCILTQAPYLLKSIKKTKMVYFFLESKR